MKSKLCTCSHAVDWHMSRESSHQKRCTIIGCACPAVEVTDEIVDIPPVMVHPPVPGNNRHTGAVGRADALIPCDGDCCKHRRLA